MIFGLDVSTSCTGWCLLQSDGLVKDIGNIPLAGKRNVFEKAQQIESELLNISQLYKIHHVVIEENLQAFRPGFSSAKTLLSLARFNGMVSYISKKIFEIEPVFINVNSARKSVGLKIDRKSNVSTKQQVLDWVSIQLSDTDHQWPVKVLKSGPRKDQEILDPVAFDMADAYVIAMAFKNLNT